MEPMHEFPSANPTFPYDAALAAARRYLASRGITEPKPLYHTLGATPTVAGAALKRAHARWFAESQRGSAGAPASAAANALQGDTAPGDQALGEGAAAAATSARSA